MVNGETVVFSNVQTQGNEKGLKHFGDTVSRTNLHDLQRCPWFHFYIIHINWSLPLLQGADLNHRDTYFYLVYTLSLRFSYDEFN